MHTHARGLAQLEWQAVTMSQMLLPVMPPIGANNACACLQNIYWVYGTGLTSIPAVVVPGAPMAGM